MSPSQPVWIFDRGPAKYFHGRKEILRNFRELVERATGSKSGTTFLIKGAPGAGKSALLHECREYAGGQGWQTVRVFSMSAFCNPNEMRHILGERKTPGDTSLEILRNGTRPLLLDEDEVQVWEYITPNLASDRLDAVINVLESIHNGKVGRPVILIAAGLGTSVDCFGSLGISKFADNCLVELGSLEKEAERAVLHDWLTRDGRANGDPTAWIDAIVQETHGWPVHFIGYLDDALEQLHLYNGAMTEEGLKALMEAGREGRTKYYWDRLHGLDWGRRCIANLFAEVPSGVSIVGDTILSSLTQKYGFDEAKKVLHEALR